MSSAIVNLSGTILATAANATLNIDSHSLLIVSRGHNATDYFANINNSGIIHQAGSPLDISSAYSIYGIGSIDDHVNCQGTLTASSTHVINLNGGLTISGTGSVNLGSGTLYVNDTSSGMSGGLLNTSYQYVGSYRAGTFIQTGGTNTTSFLSIGNGSGSIGTYNLSGGTNSISSCLYLGYNFGSIGTYNLSGGTNTPSTLCLGYNSGSIGMYNLSGTGILSAGQEYIGYSGTGMFSQTGGTNTISSKSQSWL